MKIINKDNDETMALYKFLKRKHVKDDKSSFFFGLWFASQIRKLKQNKDGI